MLKRITGLMAMACIAAPLLIAQPAQATSETECAIWVCLPGGFKSGANCGAPFSAMIVRVMTYRSPLPNFAGCLKPDGFGSGVNYSFKERRKNHRRWGRLRSSEHWIYTYANGRPTGGYYIHVSRKGRVKSKRVLSPATAPKVEPPRPPTRNPSGRTQGTTQ